MVISSKHLLERKGLKYERSTLEYGKKFDSSDLQFIDNLFVEEKENLMDNVNMILEFSPTKGSNNNEFCDRSYIMRNYNSGKYKIILNPTNAKTGAKTLDGVLNFVHCILPDSTGSWVKEVSRLARSGYSDVIDVSRKTSEKYNRLLHDFTHNTSSKTKQAIRILEEANLLPSKKIGSEIRNAFENMYREERDKKLKAYTDENPIRPVIYSSSDPDFTLELTYNAEWISEYGFPNELSTHPDDYSLRIEGTSDSLDFRSLFEEIHALGFGCIRELYWKVAKKDGYLEPDPVINRWPYEDWPYIKVSNKMSTFGFMGGFGKEEHNSKDSKWMPQIEERFNIDY